MAGLNLEKRGEGEEPPLVLRIKSQEIICSKMGKYAGAIKVSSHVFACLLQPAFQITLFFPIANCDSLSPLLEPLCLNTSSPPQKLVPSQFGAPAFPQTVPRLQFLSQPTDFQTLMPGSHPASPPLHLELPSKRHNNETLKRQNEINNSWKIGFSGWHKSGEYRRRGIVAAVRPF